MKLLPLLLLLVGCEAGAPCAWTVENATGGALETVRFVRGGGFDWSADVLADVPLDPGESVAFDTESAGTFDLQAFDASGQSYTRVSAITCVDGESHETSLAGGDADL